MYVHRQQAQHGPQGCELLALGQSPGLEEERGGEGLGYIWIGPGGYSPLTCFRPMMAASIPSSGGGSMNPKQRGSRELPARALIWRG